jgi:hypothetical protein
VLINWDDGMASCLSPLGRMHLPQENAKWRTQIHHRFSSTVQTHEERSSTIPIEPIEWRAKLYPSNLYTNEERSSTIPIDPSNEERSSTHQTHQMKSEALPYPSNSYPTNEERSSTAIYEMETEQPREAPRIITQANAKSSKNSRIGVTKRVSNPSRELFDIFLAPRSDHWATKPLIQKETTWGTRISQSRKGGNANETLASEEPLVPN